MFFPILMPSSPWLTRASSPNILVYIHFHPHSSLHIPLNHHFSLWNHTFFCHFNRWTAPFFTNQKRPNLCKFAISRERTVPSMESRAPRVEPRTDQPVRDAPWKPWRRVPLMIARSSVISHGNHGPIKIHKMRNYLWPMVIFHSYVKAIWCPFGKNRGAGSWYTIDHHLPVVNQPTNGKRISMC